MKKEKKSKHIFLAENMKDYYIGCLNGEHRHANFRQDYSDHDNTKLICNHCEEDFTQDAIDIGAIKLEN